MFLIAIFSHFIADFIFQNNKVVMLKRERMFKGNLIHSGIVFITYCVIFTLSIITSSRSLSVFESNLIIYISLLAISHFVIDLIKSYVLIKNKGNAKVDIVIFILDQLIHVAVIYIITSFFISNIGLRVIYLNSKLILLYPFIISWILATFVSSYIITKTLSCYDIKPAGDIRVGRLIGNIERTIILILLILNLSSIVAGVIVFKTLIRLENFKNSDHSDYYILGNLLSFLLVICSYGILIFSNLSRFYFN
ncbi:DUF3307 domain-containing protein [Mycoplasmatota bacterium WC44]